MNRDIPAKAVTQSSGRMVIEYVGDLSVNDVRDGAWPNYSSANLYVFAHDGTVFYVGKSVDLQARVSEHVTGKSYGGWGGYQPLTELIDDNAPSSGMWTVYLFRTCGLALHDAEWALIGALCPVLNVMGNPSPSDLPSIYNSNRRQQRVQAGFDDAFRELKRAFGEGDGT